MSEKIFCEECGEELDPEGGIFRTQKGDLLCEGCWEEITDYGDHL